MGIRKKSNGHVSYCLFQDGINAYIELAWAPRKKDVRIISKHRTYQEALDAQAKWYEDVDYEIVTFVVDHETEELEMETMRIYEEEER